MHVREIVFDSRHPAKLARFWADLLDDFEVRPYDDEELARLAEAGLTPETDPNVMVDGPGLKLCFQHAAGTAREGKNRLHLDISVEDRDQATIRATSLGATVVEAFEGSTWLRDPEGNDFCLTEMQ